MRRFFTVTFTSSFKIKEINKNVKHVLKYSWEFSGIDFCPGKYKVYANVLNLKDTYSISKSSNEFGDTEFITIWKDSSSFNDEGKKYAFSMDSYLEVPSGVTQIKLIKTN